MPALDTVTQCASVFLIQRQTVPDIHAAKLYFGSLAHTVDGEIQQVMVGFLGVVY